MRLSDYKKQLKLEAEEMYSYVSDLHPSKRIEEALKIRAAEEASEKSESIAEWMHEFRKGSFEACGVYDKEPLDMFIYETKLNIFSLPELKIMLEEAKYQFDYQSGYLNNEENITIWEKRMLWAEKAITHKTQRNFDKLNL
ncbi:hypothetical protein ACFSTE_15875 [Aquimarina hainanensis]|uniref:Uncharacterized protein n=1 Tax=Aquimarina hainanensis TaxID=1578017 RepID=A0ABW5NB90_9FLAO